LLNGNVIFDLCEIIDGLLLLMNFDFFLKIFIVIVMQSESFESGGGE
jgi:hypothetical protein